MMLLCLTFCECRQKTLQYVDHIIVANFSVHSGDKEEYFACYELYFLASAVPKSVLLRGLY